MSATRGTQTPSASRPTAIASAQEASQPRATITRDGQRLLQAELDRLRREIDVEFTARFREALAFGEAVGNDDYLQAKEEEMVLASRIADLERLLSSATVVEEAGLSGHTVGIGATVEIQDLDSGVTDERQLTGDHQPHAGGGISASSPIGRALIGRAAGDEVEVELPGGISRRLRIVGIRARAGN